MMRSLLFRIRYSLGFIVASWALMGMGDVEVQVKKVPKTTLVKGKATAPLDVNYDVLVNVLCDYDSGDIFSDDDPVDYQSTVTEGMAQFLINEVPEERDDVIELGKQSSARSTCPGNENYVVAAINLPWPLSDAWQISRFRTEALTDTTMIYFDFLGGTAKESSGYFQVRRLSDGKAELTNKFDFDVGFRIPEFLIRWGVNNALPDYFEDIESYAVEHASKYSSNVAAEAQTATSK